MNETALLELRSLINERRINAQWACDLQRRIEHAYDSNDPAEIAQARVDWIYRWRSACDQRDRAEAAILQHCKDIIETHQRGVAGDAGSESHPALALEWPVATQARVERQSHTSPVSPL